MAQKKSVSNWMLEKQITELKEDIEKRFGKIDGTIERIDIDIRGNGKEGLNTRISQAEADIRNIEEKLSGINANIVWVIRLVIGSIIATALAFFLG